MGNLQRAERRAADRASAMNRSKSFLGHHPSGVNAAAVEHITAEEAENLITELAAAKSEDKGMRTGTRELPGKLPSSVDRIRQVREVRESGRKYGPLPDARDHCLHCVLEGTYLIYTEGTKASSPHFQHGGSCKCIETINTPDTPVESGHYPPLTESLNSPRRVGALPRSHTGRGEGAGTARNGRTVTKLKNHRTVLRELDSAQLKLSQGTTPH